MKSVLVIDDNTEICGFMKDLLELHDCKVVIAGSGEEALHKNMDLGIDIVFIDICLPGMDGVETLRELKQRLPDARYILMSGFPMEHKIEEAFRIGAERFIKKPFGIEDIIDVLNCSNG